ncbi:flagellar hook-length control protein FliK [Neomoorella thermoacetica]|uniref:flagellar hook-length control protein FliK n=1 Tax=Neomoorella thermoacetica TaxID=1525 RepID=UPI0008FAF77D|nr:flagellar hook-length control protein FliK [Moorella thermoacetica]APC07896.1 flagellar hook-length control protein FliK [Moorella thermoacetica]
MTVVSISRSSDLELLTRTREHYPEPAVDFTSFLAGLIQQPAHVDRSGVYNPPEGETGGQDGNARGGLQEPAGPEPAGIAGVPGRKAMGSPREAEARPTGPGDVYQASAGAEGTAGSDSGGQVTDRDAPAAAAGKDAPAGGKGAPRSGFPAGDSRRTAAAQDKAAAGGQVKGETSLSAGKAVEAHQATSLLSVAAANVQDEAGAGTAGSDSRQPLRGNWPDLASRIEAVPGMGAAGKAAVIKGKGQVQGGLSAGINTRETGTTGPGTPGTTRPAGTPAEGALKTGLLQVNLPDLASRIGAVSGMGAAGKAAVIKGKGQVQGGLPAGVNPREAGTTGPGDPGTTPRGRTLAGEALKTGLPLEGEGRQQAGAGKPVTDANSMEIVDRSAGMPFVPDNRQAPLGSGEGKPPVRGPVPGNSLLAGDYNPANTGPSNREPAGETLTSSGGSSPVGPAAFNAVMGGNSQQAGNQVAQINNLPEVFATILSTARLAATNGRQELELQLQPENLGKLKLRALLDGGRLTLQLLVESSEAARALQAAVPEMRQAAAVQGLRLDQVQVQVGGDGQGGGRHQADSQGEYRQGAGWRRQSPGWPGSPDLEGTINRYRLDYLA